MKNGFEKIFFSNGKLENFSLFKNGLLHGVTKIYFETGELEEESCFEYGICIWSNFFDKTGNKINSTSIDENSIEYYIVANAKKQDETCS